jgi:hypothetical protein
MLLKLFNKSETIANEQIMAVANRYGLTVNGKTRVKDVIDVDKLNCARELYSFSLMAHFDILVLRDHVPLYAVEFDGPHHISSVQMERDKKKDILCKAAGLPILRINSNYTSKKFGRMSLLAWIVEVYELQIGFYEAQESGLIPWDEPFDPFAIFSTSMDSDERFPLWMSAKHRQKFQTLHKQGKLPHWGTIGYIGHSANWDILGYEFIRVNDDEGLWVQSGIRQKQFPIMFSDLLSEILTIQLSWKIDEYLTGHLKAESLSKIRERAKKFEGLYQILNSHSVSYG